jgi:RNA polymerase sigma factor (sigma-70 family)
VTSRALVRPASLAGVTLLRTQSDERLVDLVRAGNDEAFEAIVRRHHRELERYCSRFLPDARAEDAVQQAFVRAYDALRASTGEMKLRPWLYRIVHNSALNVLRERASTMEELPDDLVGAERPDQAVERHERLREVLGAVSALPVRQRDAVVLRELDGRSYEEIATTMGLTGGAVRQLLSRARTTLQAGATAITPFGLAARAGEVAAAGGGGAILAKATATVAVGGALIGGVAEIPDHHQAPPAKAAQPAARTPRAPASAAVASAAAPAPGPAGPVRPAKPARQRAGDHGGRSHSGDNRGAHSRSGERGKGNSGSGSGGRGPSAPAAAPEQKETIHRHGSGSGSSGKGPGSGDLAEDVGAQPTPAPSSASGDTGSSGPGSSGSGSGSSGSGSSSGSSGSGHGGGGTDDG